MSRIVSARIKPQTHEEIRKRCNEAGCNINDFIEASLELALTGHVEFDFGEEENISETTKN